MSDTLTLIADDRVREIDADVRDAAIRISPAALASALDWQLKDEGLCQGDICVPVRDRTRLVGDAGIDLAELARLLDRPLATDAAERVAVLGASATSRSERLRSLTAPDFALRDLSGALHRLSDHRGKKRLLIAWASW